MKKYDIEISTKVNPEYWNKLMGKFEGGFFHSYEYPEFEAVRSNASPIYITASENHKECVGIATGIIYISRHWPFSKYEKLVVLGSLPAAINGKCQKQMHILNRIERKLKQKGVYRINIKSYDSLDSQRVLKDLSYELNNRCEFYLDISIPIDDLWSQLKSTRRNRIRKAKKNKVKTIIDNSKTGVEHLYQFIEKSMNRRKIEYRYHSKILNNTSKLVESGKGVIFLSLNKDAKPINAAMFSMVGNRAYYLEGGTSKEGNNVYGPVHLFWNAIEYFKNERIKVLNLGGSAMPKNKHDPDYGLFRFKRDFGAKIISQPAGSKILSNFGNTIHLLKKSLRSEMSESLIVP